jgi:hypothetical protein
MIHTDDIMVPATKREALLELNDWKERISSFYEMLENWLTDAAQYRFEIKKSSKVTMFEEQMFRLKIKPVELPTATISKGSKLVGFIKPFGLWISKTNGVMEVNNGITSYKIIDNAPKFSKPNWKIIVRKGFDEHLKPFHKNEFQKILDEGNFF